VLYADGYIIIDVVCAGKSGEVTMAIGRGTENAGRADVFEDGNRFVPGGEMGRLPKTRVLVHRLNEL
jgi:hypothetical protein